MGCTKIQSGLVWLKEGKSLRPPPLKPAFFHYVTLQTTFARGLWVGMVPRMRGKVFFMNIDSHHDRLLWKVNYYCWSDLLVGLVIVVGHLGGDGGSGTGFGGGWAINGLWKMRPINQWLVNNETVIDFDLREIRPSWLWFTQRSWATQMAMRRRESCEQALTSWAKRDAQQTDWILIGISNQVAFLERGWAMSHYLKWAANAINWWWWWYHKSIEQNNNHK